MKVDGAWNIVIKTPMGAQASTVTFKADGGKLTGEQSAAGDSVGIENGAVTGADVEWSVDIASPMPMRLEFSGAVAGDAISGSVKLGPFGESTFSGQRA